MISFMYRLNVGVQNRAEVLKVTSASVIGTVADFYDFFVAGTASAIVWPIVFFPKSSPFAALLFSILAYGVGYITRPVGGLIFGHMGDRMGRKSTLILTLLTMGIGTLGIALTPGYASIGIMGALLIFVFRIVQGLGAGGEFGGAASLVAEFSKNSKHRAFWVSWVQQGFSIGITISALLWTYLLVSIPHPEFIAWGWRIAFYVGVVILLIGVVLRFAISESPLFKEFVEKKALASRPSLELIKTQWRKLLLLSLIPIPTVAGGVFVTTFTIPFSASLHILPAFTSSTVVYGGLIGIFTIVAFALLSERIGRKKVIYISGLAPALYAFLYLYMLSTGSYLLAGIGNVLYIVMSRFGSGAFPAVLTEDYPTRFRYSGSATSYSLAAVWGGSVIPLIATYLNGALGGAAKSWPYVAVELFIFFTISAIAAIWVSETRSKDMAY